GTLHWVAKKTAVPAEIRLYEQLFLVPDPDNTEEGRTFLDNINPESLKKTQAMLEPALRDLPVGAKVQFERVGYFCKDADSTTDLPVFNRTVTLRDSWAKLEKQNQA
ncbi:MAG: glutamine--tRNA ligase, partial [Desulfovibrio sp.]|nr:glutamine--tRNA ligase [Desulfovibrio sp.]